MGVSNIYAMTGDYGNTIDGLDGTDYAKIFTMKKKFLGSVNWHKNQILFKLIHAGNVNGYFAKTYFLGVYETTSSTTTKFQVVEDMDSTAITCVYVEDSNSITVYAKGGVSGANIRVQVLYTPNIGFIEFYNYEKFNNTLDGLTIVSPTTMNKNGELTLTLQNSWTKITSPNDLENRIYRSGNIINVNCALTGGTTSGTVVVFRIPTYPPQKRVRTTCRYKDGGGLYQNALMEINTYGDVLITGVASNTELLINISYIV